MSTRRFSSFSRDQICFPFPFLLTWMAGSLRTAPRFSRHRRRRYKTSDQEKSYLQNMLGSSFLFLLLKHTNLKKSISCKVLCDHFFGFADLLSIIDWEKPDNRQEGDLKMKENYLGDESKEHHLGKDQQLFDGWLFWLPSQSKGSSLTPDFLSPWQTFLEVWKKENKQGSLLVAFQLLLKGN